MKKLSIAAVALSLSIATPVFACPGHDAPVTADKAKPADPAKDAKATAKAAPAKTATAAKPADKVSQK
ncbi:MAG: hypothetical protein ABIY55_02140 [Kofleriaceae bacterium]